MCSLENLPKNVYMNGSILGNLREEMDALRGLRSLPMSATSSKGPVI